MTAKWTDPPRRRIGNTDLKRTNARKRRMRQGRRFLRLDLASWLSPNGWR